MSGSMHLRRWLALGAVVWSSLTPRPAHADDAVRAVRLVDLAAGRTSATIIDGSRRRIFDGNLAENVLVLPARLPPQPVLTFATGLHAGAEPTTVRFELSLRDPAGTEHSLFSREVSQPGWTDARVELAGRPLDGAALVFRRTLVDGKPVRLLQSGWGDPVIVSAGSMAPAASVILISLDTLRADHIGLGGDEAARTPTLDALGRAGVWYRNAYSPSGWTLPSHASLLYGRHLPSVPEEKFAADPNTPGRLWSLAELLRRAGYLTAGFTGGGYLAHSFGFARGFDRYYAFPQPQLTPGTCPPDRLDGREVFARAGAWLRDRGGAPFFLFLHTYDIHDRCPFRSASQPASEPWSLPPTADHRPLLAFYDDLIAATDRLIGGLVNELTQLGLADTTLIVVTGDHGEFFAERGYRGHGCDLKPYEPLVRVPLIMRYPSAIPARGEIGEPVSLIDVAPTILALLGVPIPADVRGTVLPGVGLDARHRQQPVYVVCDDKVMVRDGPTKLITSRSAAFPDELYDLGTDPGEVKSVTADTARLAPVKTLANAFQQSLPAPQKTSAAPDRQLDEGTKERLRALGYQ